MHQRLAVYALVLKENSVSWNSVLEHAYGNGNTKLVSLVTIPIAEQVWQTLNCRLSWKLSHWLQMILNLLRVQKERKREQKSQHTHRKMDTFKTICCFKCFDEEFTHFRIDMKLCSWKLKITVKNQILERTRESAPDPLLFFSWAS